MVGQEQGRILASRAKVTGQRVAKADEALLCSLIDPSDILASAGDLRVPVTHLSIDSRKVVKGNLFFALGGQVTHGNYYVEEAIDRGACAIISESPPPRHCPVPHVQVSAVRECLAKVSRLFNHFPDEQLRLVGVTGTNGKTTVSMLTKHLLGQESKTAVLGTVHYDLGRRIIPSVRTTPEAHDICAMLAAARQEGCSRAIMEVSSHGVCQKRIHGLCFETSVFLNLTPEHLDYHPTMEDYYAAKRSFVVGDPGGMPQNAIINLDDPYGKRLFREVGEQTRKIGFGEDREAHFRARHICYRSMGTEFELEHPDGVVSVSSPLIGRFNIQNLLAALAVGWTEGQPVDAMLDRLETFTGSPGRLESVHEGQTFNVFVDYAHTSDALFNLLSVLKEVTDGRLLLVFGCGGDRDQDKRPAMTRAAQEFCDYAWATADNPRGEPLDSIFEHMRAGVDSPDRIAFVKDRRRAIGFAIQNAKPRDCVVIAGKGHESYQEFNKTVVPFDDRRVARELLRLKQSSTVEIGQW